MESNTIIVERARDGNLTCKVEVDRKSKYLYSKYEPMKNICIPNINDSKSCVVIFGLGLGYELQEIEKMSGTKKIYVIENNRIFYNNIIENEEIKHIVLDSKAIFLFGDEYKKLKDIDIADAQIIINNNMLSISEEYIYKVVNYFKTCIDSEKILFFHHSTIANDCVEALKILNYNIVMEQCILDLAYNEIFSKIAIEMPDYIFTINFYAKIADITNKLGIKYISWTVDTPNYDLYKKEIYYENNIIFIYDEITVNELKNKGVRNVYYMPVAANIKRFDKIIINEEDYFKYGTDVSFVGTTGMNNEFNDFSEFLSQEAKKKINTLFDIQKKDTTKYLIKEYIDEFNKEMNFSYSNSLPILKESKRKAFLFARKFNEIERMELVSTISNKFDFKVYGDEMWKLIHSKKIKYIGQAEHFNEMPKVFKLSKININLTRIYVESGLPMRVFDVLGSKGFLVTNYKSDIVRYFNDGRDLIIYRDLQELSEIIEYYLHNERERQDIIINGYERVKHEHTYEVRLKQLMDIVKNHKRLI
ncbi:glycosyltransferase [Clostridium botulinum]|uniref:CgeB family protein n=1 Tax=Clostridium botulinum TaxID=1491 RepID=UPI0021AF0E42|nr:glycosyltransferase [Clostridium botulinum]UZP04143.1 glycosyltransferase [Clostridium botulinum]UZP07500.1 glycosyltransferase [Clostridium botulinum]UZP10882.1 glycosyltransferase [Clostridium botulinum]